MLNIKLDKNIEIKLSKTYIIIKGPFGSCIKKKDKNLNLYLDKDTNTLYFLNNNIIKNKYYYQLCQNYIWGVSKGFFKHLKLKGIGFRAELFDNILSLRLGFSHTINYNIPKNIKITVPEPTELIIEGFNKQLVAQVAAEIREFRLPEPYKGKGILYDNEIIILKEGKKK